MNRLQAISAVVCVVLSAISVVDAVLILAGSRDFLGAARGPVEGIALVMLACAIAMMFARQSRAARGKDMAG